MTATTVDTDDARWIDDDASLAGLVDILVEAPRYAMDTEFHRERTFFPQLALVQIAWGDAETGALHSSIRSPSTSLHSRDCSARRRSP
ncbi:MAG: hypothetical protein WKF58_01195 [Ilumatobacteraceae bacterium]